MQFGQKIKKTPWRTVRIYKAVVLTMDIITRFSSFEYFLITSLDFYKRRANTSSILSLWFESGLQSCCFSSCFAFACMDTEIKSRIWSNFFNLPKLSLPSKAAYSVDCCIGNGSCSQHISDLVFPFSVSCQHKEKLKKNMACYSLECL